ncbi:MAG: bifunctional UDP-N-acetylglucosamine diphosphorylase/glucosamine-1-phosphate N-acetyltransferase GlmU [Chloroflexi bacterium]|nr:bifunctional UDP-N-acetylglucosamine diphosphorylase/glucosamine-1-phosphate N-acetyltransferase GlmU [Chloroflexota bacterium]
MTAPSDVGESPTAPARYVVPPPDPPTRAAPPSTLGAVVLAAGQGTRMRSRRPKVLHDLAGRPLLWFVLQALGSLQPSQTVVVVGHGADEVRAALGDAAQHAYQAEQLGTGHAVTQAEALLAGRCAEVLVLYGDSPLLQPATLHALVAARREHGAALALLSAVVDDPTGYGRVLRRDGTVVGVLEEREASPEQRALREINSGVYCFAADWLWPCLRGLPRRGNGEYYLTDLVAAAVSEGRRVVAVPAGDPVEALGINDRVQLAQAEQAIQRRLREQHMRQGVTLRDPDSCFFDVDVVVEPDTTILPGTLLQGRTRIGRDCVIGPHSRLRNAVVGERCVVDASVVADAELADDVHVGPFSHVRGGARLEQGVFLGNFAEVKNSRLGARTHMHHFSYLGDADVGADVNVGAGTITCNFDSESRQKSRTTIGDRAALGSDTMLVAPVHVGAGAITGAGAVVTRDVPPEGVAVGIPAKVVRRRRGAGPAGSQ